MKSKTVPLPAFPMLPSLLVLMALLASGCQSVQPLAYAPPENLDLARDYLLEHYQTPVEYVTGKFDDHDLVFLGEFHRLRHDPELVQALIPALNALGVKNLVIEFANYADQERIDALVSAPAYDESLAREISLNSLLSIGVGGYREYCDIFKAAWRVNQGLAPDEARFRVIGINNSYDWSILKSPGDAEDESLRAKVLGGQTEGDWAGRVLIELVSKGQKALVYCGSHHAFTRYRQPIVRDGKAAGFADGRFGNLLYEVLGDRVFMIFLHSPWFPSQGYEAEQLVLPCDGAMDYLLGSLPAGRRSFGVDAAGTPLGDFSGASSAYALGYEDFRLSDFCDGYLCQGFLTDYKPIVMLGGFINAGNLAKARRGFPNPRFRDASAALFNRIIREDAGVYWKIFSEGLRDAERIYAVARRREW